MNKIILMGRLTATPELKTTQNGTSVTSFTIAVSRNYASQGGERQTDFIDCVAWRQRAEFITKYFSKGNMIAVCGSLETRMYTDKNGNNRKAFEVIVDEAHFTGSKSESGSYARDNSYSQDSAPAASYSSGSAGDFESTPTDDDLPF